MLEINKIINKNGGKKAAVVLILSEGDWPTPGVHGFQFSNAPLWYKSNYGWMDSSFALHT